MLLLALFVGLLSILPLARLVYAALVTNTGFDLARISDVLGGRRVMEATINTIWISLAATALATIAGTLAALLVGASDMKGRTAWVFGFVLPLMIPPQVIALAWIQAFSPASPVMSFLGLSLEPGMRHPLYSSGGIVLLLGIYNAPLVFLSVRANLRRVPAALVEAARAVGASPARATLGVILPLIRGGIFAGAALAFVSSIGNFGIQAMLGIPARGFNADHADLSSAELLWPVSAQRYGASGSASGRADDWRHGNCRMAEPHGRPARRWRVKTVSVSAGPLVPSDHRPCLGLSSICAGVAAFGPGRFSTGARLWSTAQS